MSCRQIPNAITISRAVLALIALALYWGAYDWPTVRSLVSALYIVGVLTDYLDGEVARRYGWETVFGKVADPIADKTLWWAGAIILWGQCPGSWGDSLHLALLGTCIVVAIYDLIATSLEIALALRLVAENDSRFSAKLRFAVMHVVLALYLMAEATGTLSATTYAAIVLSFGVLAVGLTIVAVTDYLLAHLPRPTPAR